MVAVNLGKNKTSLDHIDDYLVGLKKFKDLADFIVINLSSPNTPGLRNLQSKDRLEELLSGIDSFLEKNSDKRPKILIKLAPDLSDDELKAVAKTAMKWSSRVVSGLIMGNTTVSRPESLQSDPDLVSQAGGLSGKPLKELSTKKLARLYNYTGGRIPIIGAGGISTGRDAFEKVQAGASLVEVYSALVYEGPGLVHRVKTELNEQLKAHGYKNIAEAVGTKASELAK